MTDWSNLPAIDRASQPGGADFWSTNQPQQWTYDQRNSASRGINYDPSNASASMSYDPDSTFTFKIIDAQIQSWMQQEYPELYNFESGLVNPGTAGGGGNVARKPGYGQFAQTPEVYGEIEAAANRHGVPANFLKVILAREGSGDWATNNAKGAMPIGTRNGARILPYIGVFEDTARQRAPGVNFGALVGNRAGQIDLLAQVLKSQYNQITSQNPNYNWINVAAYHYSGDPTGRTSPKDGWKHYPGGTPQYMQLTRDEVASLDAWTKANGGQVGTGAPTTGGISSPNSPIWTQVNKWDSMVANAASRYNVPANLIKSVMQLESNGNPNVRSPQGATGLMQVMPFHVGGNVQLLLDPARNIDIGTRILADNYRRYGTWEMATKAYLGLVGEDAHGTGNVEYWGRISGFWNQLDRGLGATQPVYGAPAAPNNGPTTNLSAIWGNVPGLGYITQEHGPGQFARDHPSWYEYSIPLLGELGHPGVDLGMPTGTKLYSPVSGTVVLADPSRGYKHGNSNAPQTGGLWIRTAAGHDVILGHMAGIAVAPGTKVTAGQYVGLSGDAGTGPHLHLEWRIPNGAGGWKAIDPRQALRGAFAGGFTEPTQAAGITRAMTFQEMLKASAEGKPVDYGQPMDTGGNSWNSWLQNAMAGRIPHIAPGSYAGQTGAGNYAGAGVSGGSGLYGYSRT